MSGFVIKYIDIYNLLWEYKEKLETLIEDIGYCENSINDFITSTAFQGEAATSIKNYMNEVHITLLSSFKVTAQNILDNLILYKAGYYDIDSSTNFVLPEEEIKAFRTKLNGNALDTEEYADKVKRKLGEVSDIYQVSHPDTNGVFKIHQQIDQELLNFLTDIETQEQTTVTALEQSAELLISGLKNCVSKIGNIDITNYESNSFYQDAEVYALASLSQNCYQNHETYKGVYDEIWTNEQGLRDAADARETQGIWKTVGGVFLVVGGTVCIVASGGAATPIVAAGWTAGGGTIAFGVADSIEGAQDIYYGSIGDIDSTSMNYLKSVVFQGNEDAYYLTENVFAFASSAFIPISQAARVGNLTFRSGVTTVAKEGIAMMAGAGASDVTMRVTGSQTASVVAGMLTSWGTGQGLNGVDTRFNISGNRENTIFYSEFSQRAGTSGLTRTQIARAYEAMRTGDYEKMASYFDTSSPENGAVFWSGNKEGAAAYANGIGGTIMEQTPGGQVFDNWEALQRRYPQWEDQRPIWEALSSQYANGAEGIATYVHPNGYVGKVWANIEKPILEEKDIIIQEVIIDAK